MQLPKLYKAGHRVVVFSQMTRLMDILGVYLELHGIKFLRYDGSTKPEEREALVRQFNAANSPHFKFLQSTHTGSLGLDLHTADTGIIFDSDWNLPMYKQADKIASHCIGKKRAVRVFLLVSVGSLEEAIMEHAKPKMGIGAMVIQAGLLNPQNRREMLEDIMRKGSTSLGRDVPREREREINYLAARFIEEFWMFEKIEEFWMFEKIEEFWMFEKMDNERPKDNDRSRLIEENEVPEWAYTQPDPNNTRTWKIHKRKRSRCIYMPPHAVLGSANVV